MRRTVVLTLSIALTLTNFGFAQVGNLIVNGGFEIADPVLGSYSPQGWYLADPDFDASTLRYNGGYLGAAPHSGSYFIWGGEMAPEGSDPLNPHAGILQQTGIETLPGVHYTLSFWLRNLAGAPPDNSIEIYWNNFDQPGVHGPLTMTNIAASDTYTQYFVDLVGGELPGILTFEMYNPPTALLLDDVSLTEAAPEPGTWLLFGSALVLAGIGKVRARSKQ